MHVSTIHLGLSAAPEETYCFPMQQYEDMLADIVDAGWTMHADHVVSTWVRLWANRLHTQPPLAPEPTLSQMVADLRRFAPVEDWPIANVARVRLAWGLLWRLSPAPWCVHGRMTWQWCIDCKVTSECLVHDDCLDLQDHMRRRLAENGVPVS